MALSESFLMTTLMHCRSPSTQYIIPEVSPAALSGDKLDEDGLTQKGFSVGSAQPDEMANVTP